MGTFGKLVIGGSLGVMLAWACVGSPVHAEEYTVNGEFEITYTEGEIVTLTAVAPKGYRFVKWGGACLHAKYSKTCTLAMTESRVVSMQFEPVLAKPIWRKK
jgi:hypothetical protein